MRHWAKRAWKRETLARAELLDAPDGLVDLEVVVVGQLSGVIGGRQVKGEQTSSIAVIRSRLSKISSGICCVSLALGAPAAVIEAM
jgi:hypothetical protein